MEILPFLKKIFSNFIQNLDKTLGQFENLHFTGFRDGAPEAREFIKNLKSIETSNFMKICMNSESFFY